MSNFNDKIDALFYLEKNEYIANKSNPKSDIAILKEMKDDGLIDFNGVKYSINGSGRNELNKFRLSIDMQRKPLLLRVLTSGFSKIERGMKLMLKIK